MRRRSFMKCLAALPLVGGLFRPQPPQTPSVLQQQIYVYYETELESQYGWRWVDSQPTVLEELKARLPS